MAVAHASWTATAYVSFRMPSTTDRADGLGFIGIHVNQQLNRRKGMEGDKGARFHRVILIV